MKIEGYEVALGLSATRYKPADITRFTDFGFTHFEIGVFCSPELEEEIRAKNAEKQREEIMVEKMAPLFDAVAANKGRMWTVHLPFGKMWDISQLDDDGRASALESQRKFIELTRQWNPRAYVLHPSAGPVIENRPIRIAYSIANQRILDKLARKQGARLCMENLPRQGLANTNIETRAMMLAADVPLIFDVNHLLQDEHREYIEMVGSNVFSTHLSDYDRVDEKHWLPGSGCVPWNEVFTGLLKKNYTGPFLFELREGPNGLYDPEEIYNAFVEAVARR